MGMRIVGGKLIPGGGGEVGAYVAAIYPGGVAEQLHGELREGERTCDIWLVTIITIIIK